MNSYSCDQLVEYYQYIPITALINSWIKGYTPSPFGLFGTGGFLCISLLEMKIRT